MKGPWKLLAALAVGTAALTACTGPSTPTSNVASTPSVTPPQEHYPSVPVVTWDAKSEQGAKDTALQAMTSFARPAVDARTWFSDLAPLLAADYKVDAQYIDPARVTVSTVKSGPVLNREQQNPLTATALFETNDGQWVVSIHRTGQTDPWLVTAIAPKNS